MLVEFIIGGIFLIAVVYYTSRKFKRGASGRNTDDGNTNLPK